VSGPSRHASAGDPLGACVVTVVDDGDRAAITVCGSGLAGSSAGARSLLDAILALTGEPGMLRRAVT
jgi:CO dehydrogenase/acetyl-CoA synthase alpha subunit